MTETFMFDGCSRPLPMGCAALHPSYGLNGPNDPNDPNDPNGPNDRNAPNDPNNPNDPNPPAAGKAQKITFSTSAISGKVNS